MDDLRYKVIYHELSCAPCTSETLCRLKEFYEAEINSKRCLDSISNLTQLLRILEKRDCLSSLNVDPFYEIAHAIESRSTKQLLADDVKNKKNQIGYERQLQNANSVFPEIPRTAKDRAYQLISSGIGQKWQDFARKLQISEGYIDDLGIRHQRIVDRVYDILNYHENTCDSRVWQSQLLNALGEARRNDLRRDVQHIFDTCQ